MNIKKSLWDYVRQDYKSCKMNFPPRKKFMPFVELKNDVAFRKVFGNENRKIIAISFINAVLKLEGDQRIQEIDFLDPNQPPLIDSLKASILDLRAKDASGKTYIIEMQVSKLKDLRQRILYYVSKEYVGQISVGRPYGELNPVIFIGIFDFDFTEGKDYLSHHAVRNVNTGERVIDGMDFFFIELTKFSKPIETLSDTMDEWIALFKSAGSLEQVPSNISDAGILAAFDDLKKHGWTDDELDAYIRSSHAVYELDRQFQDAREEGLEQGLEQGRLEGFDLARGQMIKMLQDRGMSSKEIEEWMVNFKSQ